MKCGWVQTNIPVIGTVRVGHVKNPMGLEGDMTASSRCMTFMERSSYSEAIELNQNFVTGIWFSNNYFDQRMTWAAAAFRPDQAASTGAFFGDGQSGVQARLTGLPLYEDEGRHLLHLGISGGWRNGTANLASAAYTGNTIQLRARPELRDDDPAGSRRRSVIPNANSNRMVDTGVIASDNEYLMGLEALVHPRAVLVPGRVRLELDQQRGGRRAELDGNRLRAACPSSELHVQRRIHPTGVHADRREPRLRQARRHSGPGILRQAGSLRKRLDRPG